MAEDYSWITTEMFDNKIEELAGRVHLEYILALPGVLDIVREEFNNEAIEELEAEREEDDAYRAARRAKEGGA